jgi:hypothetical protein
MSPPSTRAGSLGFWWLCRDGHSNIRCRSTFVQDAVRAALGGLDDGHGELVCLQVDGQEVEEIMSGRGVSKRTMYRGRGLLLEQLEKMLWSAHRTPPPA